MKTFKIQIVETLERTIEVQADNVDEALLKAEYDYNIAEIVLDYDDHVDTEFYDITDL